MQFRIINTIINLLGLLDFVDRFQQFQNILK